MKHSFIKYTLTLIVFASLFSGCVMAQITERQGTKAFLQKDYATAYNKYSEAAADGNADAQYHLASMYADGLGVPQDYTKAANLLSLASAQGQTDAQLMLGLFYIYGDGVVANPSEGARLLTLSAAGGNDVSMYYLGTLYATGLGVKKDIPTALGWMQKAKKKGFPVEEVLLTAAGLEALYKD